MARLTRRTEGGRLLFMGLPLLVLFWAAVGVAALGLADLFAAAYGPRWYVRWRAQPRLSRFMRAVVAEVARAKTNEEE